MPVGFTSAAKNLFLLGSSGAQTVTNFFKAIAPGGSDNVFVPDEIKYNYADEKYVLAGSAVANNNDGVGWFEKRDDTGALDWDVRLEANSGSLTLRAMELDSSNNLVVCGFADGLPWIAKYDNSGVIQWKKTSNTGNVRYLGVTSDSNGDYYACGRTSLVGDAESVVEKYNSNGTPAWGKTMRLIGRDIVLTSIQSNSQGYVICTGQIEDLTGIKAYIVKIDSSDGSILWDRTIESHEESATLGHVSVYAQDVFIDDNNEFFVVGRLSDANSERGFIVKYTAEGNMLWQKETPVGEKVEYYNVKSLADTGQTIVFGRYTNSSNEVLGILVKYSRSGDIVWRRTIKSSNASPSQFGGFCLDFTPTFYYVLFFDEEVNTGTGDPDRYTYGKVSSSGNGLGDFQYDDGSGQTIDYEIVNFDDVIGKLFDGSVRQDVSDLVTYPFSANKLLFDDLATQVTNKKTQMDESGFYEVGSNRDAVAPTSFAILNLTHETYSGSGPWLDTSTNKYNVVTYGDPTSQSNYWEMDGTDDRFEVDNFTVGGRSEMTIEAWVYVTAFDNGAIYEQKTGNTGVSLRAGQDNGNNAFIATVCAQDGTVITNTVSSSFVVGANKWLYTRLFVKGAQAGHSTGTVELAIFDESGSSSVGFTNPVTTTAISSIADPLDAKFTIGSSSGITETAVSGEIAFTSAGQFSTTLPSGVSEVSAVLVGGGGGGAASTRSRNGVSGGGGGGGALHWRNAISVTGGSTLYVTVGSGGSGGSGAGNNNATDGGDSYLRTGSHSGTILARAGGGGEGRYNSPNVFDNSGDTYSGTYGGGGANGGRGGRGQNGHAGGGGGGAGGYSGSGGSGNDGSSNTAQAGTGGAGGGGGSVNSTRSFRPPYGGGGVGIYGEGSSGNAGTNRTGSTASALLNTQGFAGSGGTSQDPSTSTREIGYGGGGQGNEDDGSNGGAPGASGAVRILWGSGRSFPSTDVGYQEGSGGGGSRADFSGRIGEVRVYDYQLTTTQQGQNRNATKTYYGNPAADTDPDITSTRTP